MTRVVIVGEAYLADLSVGGGPIMPGPGYPSHPWVPPSAGAPGYPSHPWVPPPYPDQGLPPGSPGFPSHPWVPPQPGSPSHPWVPPSPGSPTHPWVPPSGGQPPQPTHPIAPGGPPLGIWGGAPLPVPTPPIYLPPGTLPDTKPEHPIYIPPSSGIPGVPTHPIVLPPPGSSEKPEVLENWNVVTAWTPESGWIVAIVPSESHPGMPTPSAQAQT